MSGECYNLAIETSGRGGAVALGDERAIIGIESDGPQSSELMVMIERLCAAHGVSPRRIGELYVSVGPGSFTGLRIGLAAAKTIAQVTGARVVAVATLDVVAQNAPADHTHLAACLNRKRDTVYAGLFKRDGDVWRSADEPSLRTMAQLLADAPRPLALLGDPLPPLPADARDVTVLPAALAVPDVHQVWRLGRQAARHGGSATSGGRFTDPASLVPLYIRPPEAVALWDKRHGNH